MPREIKPKESRRAAAYELWHRAPNPMVTIFKTLDVTNLVKIRKKRKCKFHMLLDYCVGRAVAGIEEFYLLPVGDRLLQYDALAVNTIVKNKTDDINSCDILYTEDLQEFNRKYLTYTAQVFESCQDRDLSENCMAIGTSDVTETEIDGVVGMYSGIFNNPFLFWGRYYRRRLHYELKVSFQFHHTQMDGAHASSFLQNLQTEISHLKFTEKGSGYK